MGMATPPPIPNPLNEANWINLLKLRRYDNSLVSNMLYPLRDKFYHAAGLLCPTEINCSFCGGEGMIEACEYCEEGHQECQECDGNGRSHCQQCDGEGQVWIDCEACDNGDVDCGMSRCKDGIVKCEECKDGKLVCPMTSCEGSGKDSQTDGEDCGNCDGEGEVDCEECVGEGEYECDDCNGVGTVACNECEGNAQIEEECDTCDGEGETYCDWCEDGWAECNECGGDYEQSDCHNCDGNGVFVVEHERAGQYFLNPTKNNREIRTQLMKEVIKSAWPKIHNAGYNIEYKPSKKITNKYINNKIHNKVVIYILPYGETTRMIVIYQPKQFTRDKESQAGVRGTAYIIKDTMVQGQHIYSSRAASYGGAINLAPYHNEAMVITADIDIWKPFTLNYLISPDDKI